MGQKFSEEQANLYRRVDEILHYLWDPIGVSRIPEARDEYQSYVPKVFSLLSQDAAESDIAAFLTQTATETMGLSDTRKGREHSREIASILLAHRDVLLRRAKA